MKRIIALLLCLVFALTTLAACNVSDDDGANDNGTKEENNENNQTNNKNNENETNNEKSSSNYGTEKISVYSSSACGARTVCHLRRTDR